MPWNFNAGSPMINYSDNFELRIHVVDADVTKILPLDPEATIFQLCEDIRKNIREANTKSPKSYGLFLPHDDWRKGLWLDNSKTLQHYILKRGDTLEYRNKFRWLHIRTMDGTSKTLKVDDSWTVAELMLNVCTKLGIYNYDEYSLIGDRPEISPGIDKTLSMKRTLNLNKDQEKLDKLKKKYHTEDGLNWLNPSQSLRQQGIEEAEVLLLKRKYFFSDMNVDSRDPIQLSLLYEQLKDAVINGTHPVTNAEAIELAGIQCQVQLGNYSPDKFKLEYLDLQEYLPKEYRKNPKPTAKKIFIQHAKLTNLSDVEARQKYCLLCRSLKTYGITFFLVKEKVVGKNKLIPRLLGVNKDSVVQVDERTKEIINTWPLTSIRKWAASFNGFTMDFGEYSPGEYYTAQTDKGERISQLIAGYIDIILKRKKAKDHLGVDADEESVMFEENIAPSKAIIVEHVPKQKRSSNDEESIILRKSARLANASVRYGSQASDSMDYSQEDIALSRQTSTFMRAQSPSSSMTTNSMHYRMSDDDIRQKLYVLSLQDNLSSIQSYKEQLIVQQPGPELGKDEVSQQWIYTNIDNSRQRIADEIGAMNAAVAQVLRSAQGLATIEECEEEELNEEMIAKMQNSFSLITVHLPSLMEEIKTTAYYQDQLIDEDESGEELIVAAKKLADAFTNLIKAAYPLEDQRRTLNRKDIFDAANAVGEASNDLLQHITEQENCQIELKSGRPHSIVLLTEQDQIYQEELLRLAKEVANETTKLIRQVKVIAIEAENAEDQRQVVKAATETGLAISQLIATTKIVAPTIEQQVCQEQLVFSIEDVSKAIQVVVKSSNKATQSEELKEQMNLAADEVQESLDKFIKHLKKDFDKNNKLDNFLVAYEDIQDFNEDEDDPNKLIAAARRLAQATAAMISEIQLQATNEESQNPEQRDKLIKAAKQLAEATSHLIDSAKNCTMSPDEPQLRLTLREAAERFIVITYTSECAEYIQEQVMEHLLVAARRAATTGTHLINTSQSAAKKSRASNFKVCNDGHELSNQISRMIIAIKEARQDPKDNLAQLELIAVCRDYIEPSEQLSQSNKFMWPTVSDPSLQTALNQSINQSVIATEELKKCIHQAYLVCQHLDLSAAIEQLNRLEKNLNSIKKSIEMENLIPLPDEKSEESTLLLIKSVKQSGSAANTFRDELETRCLIYEQTSGEDKYQNLENLDIAGRKARELSASLQKLIHASRGVAASIELENQDDPKNSKDLEKEAQLQIINNCLKATRAAHDLVQEAKINPADSGQMNRIQTISIELSDALSLCLDSLPGQRDLDMLWKYIETRKHQFAENRLAQNGELNFTPDNYKSELTDTTFELNQAINELVSAQSFNVVNRGCKKLKISYDRIVDICYVLVNDVFDDDNASMHHVFPNKNHITSGIITISGDCQKLLECVKEVQCEPDNISSRKNLQESSKMLLDSVNRLLTGISTNLRPGQKECDKIICRLESMRPILDNPIHPISHKDYYDCLDFIIEKTMQPLADSLKTIPVSVNEENNQKFIDSVYQCGDCVCVLLEETAQTAYLVGIGDARSKAGKKGLVDHSSFLQIQKEIIENCRIISNSSTNAREMITRAGNIAESTGRLCEASKTIMVSYPNDKIILSDKTKTTLLTVSNLMTEVQNFNKNTVDKYRIEIESCSVQVQNNVVELVQLLLGYKFAGDAAHISNEAKESQGPIKAAGITVLDTAIEIIQCSKSLISYESNEEQFVLYSSSCKDFNDALKHLISTIKDSAPGQKECDEALALIAKLLKHAYDSKMKIMKNRSINCQRSNESEVSFQNVLQGTLIQMPRCVNDLVKAGKKEPEQLAHIFSRQSQLLESMVTSCICAANQTDLVQNSTTYIEHLITILEASEQLLKAVKKSGGNPKATQAHLQINEMAQGVIESCNDLLEALDKISFKQGSIGTIVETINKSYAKVQESSVLPNGNSKFGNSQSKMLTVCYEMDSLTSDISENAASESTQRLLAPLALNLTQKYDDLCEACQTAVAILEDERKGKYLQECVKSVGNGSINLVKSTSDIRPSIGTTVTGLQLKAKELHKRIDDVIQILMDNNIGTLACSQAIKILKEINKDVEISILFLKSSDSKIADKNRNSSETIQESRNSIISNCNDIVQTIKMIVSKNVFNLNILSENANQIASQSKCLAKDIQSGLDYSNSTVVQYNIELLKNFQEVILSLICLLETARNTSVLSYTHPSYQTLNEEGKRSVNSITSLLKALKSYEMGNAKDFHAIDNAITELDRCHLTLTQLLSDVEKLPNENNVSGHRSSVGSDVSTSPKFTVEEISRLLPSLSNATTKILELLSVEDNSSCSQADILAASVYCTKVNGELSNSCKNLVQNGPVTESKKQAVDMADQIVKEYSTLLKALKNNLQNPSKQSQLSVVSSARQITQLIKLLREQVDSLREGPRLVMYFRPSSPEWRDVSEKYIGRHIAYHHCYIKSYHHHNSEMSMHNHNHNSSFVQLPINARDPSEIDVDNAKKQIKYITTKLIDVQLNPELVGKNKCSVAEVDAMLTYIKDIGFSAENLLSSSQHICKSNFESENSQLNTNFKKDIYKSAIGVANAMKDLCEATSASFSSGCSPIGGDRMTTATRKVANSTGQLLLYLKPTVSQNKVQVEKIHAHGNQIKKNADLLLNSLNCINDRKMGNELLSMNEVMDNEDQTCVEQKEHEALKTQPNSLKIDSVSTDPSFYDGDNKNLV